MSQVATTRMPWVDGFECPGAEAGLPVDESGREDTEARTDGSVCSTADAGLPAEAPGRRTL